MHDTSIYYEWTDEKAGTESGATKSMRSMRVMGMLDDNLDDSIQMAEIRER